MRANYKTVLDEIEDDIIQDTLTRLNIAATLNPQLYASQVCLLRNKTRSEKAFTFLQYVLGNEHVLSEFSKAFAYHSQVKLERVKCRNCSLSEGTKYIYYCYIALLFRLACGCIVDSYTLNIPEEGL